MKKLVFVFLLSTILYCASLRAQDGMLVVWDSQMTDMVDFARTVSLNAVIPKEGRQGPTGISPRSSTTPGTSAPTSTPPVKLTRLRFTPAPRISKRIKTDFTRALVKANPQSAEEIERKLAQQDVIGDFARDMSPYGLRADDVADSMTAYWITMWMIANQEPAPAVQKVAMVQRQIRASVIQDPKMLRMSNGDRQEIAEGLIYETMLAFGMLNNAKADSVKFQQLADDAQRNMLKKGVDLQGLHLTSAGFAIL